MFDGFLKFFECLLVVFGIGINYQNFHIIDFSNVIKIRKKEKKFLFL